MRPALASGPTAAQPSRPGRARRAPGADAWPSRRDPNDPAFKSVERVQRGKLIVDVAAADLEMAEARLGAFHETTWYFRSALAEARRSWDRLRAVYGGGAMEAALAEPPVTVLTLGDDGTGRPLAILIPIAGRTYRAQKLEPTELVRALWRLTQLQDPAEGRYHVARLRDGSTRCDCAEWIYQIDAVVEAAPCKHLAALAALGWL